MDDYHLIEAYIDDTLDVAGRQQFQQKLAEDADFAAAFKLRQEMDAFLEKRPQREELKRKLDTISAEFKGEEKETEAKVVALAPNRKRWYWIAGIAAAIALILVLIWPFLFPSSLYEKYNEHRPLALQERGNTERTAIESAFNNHQYEEAYQGLKTYLEKDPEDVRAQLALGISALELDRFEEATDIFESIREGTSALAQTASWYLALTYVKQGQLEQARPYLEQIPEGTFWYAKAQELLQNS